MPNDRAPDTPPRLPAPFWRIWAGQTLSTIGSTLSAIGVAVFVYLETGSAASLGLLAALASLPFVLVSPFLGLVDRFPRRTVMIVADCVAAVGPAVALALAVTDRLEIWHLAVAGFVGGLGTAVQLPAAQAAIPSLVPRGALDRANGLSQFGPAMGIVIGPVLATPLVAWFGIEAVLLADIVTFAIAVTLTIRTRFSDIVEDAPPDDDRTWGAVRTWLRGPGRPLLSLLGVMAVVNFCLAFFNVGALVLATTVAGASRAGLVLAAGGVAMIVGSVLVGRRGLADRRVGTLVRALTVIAAGLALMAIRPVFGLVVAGAALALVSVPAANAATSTIFHERVPSSMQGRVFGLRGAIGRALDPLGSVVAGFMIATLAEPALHDEGALAGSLGRVVGVGDGRGAAAVLLLVAGALAIVAYRLRTNRSVAMLDGPFVPAASPAEPISV